MANDDLDDKVAAKGYAKTADVASTYVANDDLDDKVAAAGYAKTADVNSKIGDLAELPDTNYAKTATNLVDAVKGVDAQVKSNTDNIGTVGDLSSTNYASASNLVDAVEGVDAALKATNDRTAGIKKETDGTVIEGNFKVYDDGGVAAKVGGETAFQIDGSNGNVSVNKNLAVKEEFTAADGKFAVSDDGGLTVNTDAGQSLQVAGDTGKVTVGKDMDVKGNQTVAGSATFGNAIKTIISDNKIDADGGNALIVEGVTLQDNAITANSATIGGNTIVNGDGIQTNKAVIDDVTIDGSAIENSAGSITVEGMTFDATNGIDTSNKDIYAGTGKIEGATITDGYATLTEGTLAGTNYEINKDGSASLAGGEFTVAKDSGDTNVGGTLDVEGTATFKANTQTDGIATFGTTPGAQTTINGGTIVANTDSNHQVVIDATGLKVGKNSVKMDDDGLYVGTNVSGNYNYDNAKAAMRNSDGALKAASGKFEVDEDGAVKAANGQFKVDKDGNTTIQGNLKVTSDAGNNSFVVNDSSTTNVVKDGTSNIGTQVLAADKAVSKVTDGTSTGRQDVAADKVASKVENGSNVGEQLVVEDKVVSKVTDGTSTGRQDVAADKVASKVENGSNVGEQVVAENKVVSKVTDGTNNARQDMQANKIVTEVNSGSGSFNQTIDAKNGMVIVDNNSLDKGTQITGTDVSVDDAEYAGNRINLSDLGQIDEVDGELAAYMDKYGKEHTAVNAINSEAEIRRAEIKRVEERLDKVGAMSAAMASLRTMGYDPAAPTEFAMSLGHYRGETGMAMGLFHYPKQDFMLSAQLSYADDEYMAGIGATWRFGRKNPEQLAQYEKEKAAKAKLAKALAEKEAKAKAQSARHTQMAKEKK